MNRKSFIKLLAGGIAVITLTAQEASAKPKPSYTLGEDGGQSSLGMGPRVVDWRENYPSFKVEVKAWVDEDGKKGHEAIPQVGVDADPNFNFITSPFLFKLKETHALTAIPELDGKTFAFWQSEKTGMIQRDPRLGFNGESDTWWANYY